ncbi:hypothetical protein RB195_020092 [Necator americanus]|uniref:Kunitz/Bovine pancreatic trypsin inhibitor domain protein n=1 Tax=Necator americanus TaxID=51031 RepID=A0ABR1CH80_NECAM
MTKFCSSLNLKQQCDGSINRRKVCRILCCKQSSRIRLAAEGQQVPRTKPVLLKKPAIGFLIKKKEFRTNQKCSRFVNDGGKQECRGVRNIYSSSTVGATAAQR